MECREAIGTTRENKGEHTRALEQFQVALALAEDLGARNYIAECTGDIGRLYATPMFEEYDPDRAEEFFLHAIEIATEVGDRDLLYKIDWQLSELYRQQGKWEQSHRHLARYLELKDQVQSHEAHKKAQQFEHLKQIAEMEKRRAIDQAEAKASELRAQLLESQLEHKQQQLVSTAVSLARQSEILRNFRTDLRGMMRNTTDMAQVIAELKRKLKELPEEAIDWAKFEGEFEQTYPEFRAKLMGKHPDLTKTEARICSLLRLKLISTDIAQLLSITERSVEFHRLNIRKKLGLKRGEELAEALAGI
jgi:DNA-binding CsgD family transcriptional regulator